MKPSLLLTLIFLCCNLLHANDTLFVNLNYLNSQENGISVELKPRFSNEEAINSTIFFRKVRGSKSVKITDWHVDHNTKFFENDFGWWVKDIGQVNKIQYTVNTINRKNSGNEPPLINLKEDKFYFSQLVALIPEITSDNFIIAVNVDYDEELFSPQLEDNATLYFSSYYDLSKKSIVIGKFDEIVIPSENGNNYQLFFYNEEDNKVDRYLDNFLQPVINDLETYLKDFDLLFDKIILCSFDKASESSSHDFWGGAVNQDYIYLTIPTTSTRSRFREMLQKTFVHEFLHQITPLSLFTNKTFETVDKHKKYSKHLWLYEGVTEYLSWHFLLKYGYIEERDFKEVFGKKIAYGNAEKINLINLSENIHNHKSEYKTHYFYDKAAVLAFLLDIQINRESEGRQNLLNTLQSMIDQDEVYDDASFIEQFGTFSNDKIANYLVENLSNSNYTDPNTVLKEISWEYKEKSEEKIPSFGSFRIRPNSKRPFFVITEAKRNQLGLLDGDAINAINGTVLSVKNGDELIKKFLYMPLDYDEVELEILRDGELVKLKGQPGDKLTTFTKYIHTRDNGDEKSLQLRNWLFDR